MTEPEQLRDLLGFYRDGRDGQGTGRTFDDAWPAAVERVCKYSSKPDYWRREFERERSAWEGSYERREQSDRERGLLTILESWGHLTTERCEWCDGPMSGRAPQARFCSPKCRRRAANKRERVTRKHWPSARGRLAFRVDGLEPSAHRGTVNG